MNINPSASVPMYLQIIEQVKYQIATDVLVPNDELPSVRALAKQHLINPNTVARAYLELEREGVIYKRRGMGTYVAEQEVTMSLEEKVVIVKQLMDKALVQGVQLGLDEDQLRQVFENGVENFKAKT